MQSHGFSARARLVSCWAPAQHPFSSIPRPTDPPPTLPWLSRHRWALLHSNWIPSNHPGTLARPPRPAARLATTYMGVLFKQVSEFASCRASRRGGKFGALVDALDPYFSKPLALGRCSLGAACAAAPDTACAASLWLSRWRSGRRPPPPDTLQLHATLTPDPPSISLLRAAVPDWG